MIRITNSRVDCYNCGCDTNKNKVYTIEVSLKEWKHFSCISLCKPCMKKLVKEMIRTFVRKDKSV